MFISLKKDTKSKKTPVIVLCWIVLSCIPLWFTFSIHRTLVKEQKSSLLLLSSSSSSSSSSLMNQLKMEQQILISSSSSSQHDRHVTKSSYVVPCIDLELQTLLMKQEQHLIKQKAVKKPIWVVGYPGSGNDLLRTIVGGMVILANHTTSSSSDNSFVGADIYVGDHCQNAVTCKTHWPSILPDNFPAPRFIHNFQPNAILLLRNPANAIPSHFNYNWEKERHIQDHSQQGSESDWKAWRNSNFKRQIRAWKKVIDQWVLQENTTKHRYPPDATYQYRIQTIVPYEQMVVPQHGPILMQQLAEQLDQANVTTVISDKRRLVASSSNNSNNTILECQWKHFVQDRPTKKRKGHKYIPSYTSPQKQIMLRHLEKIIQSLQQQQKQPNDTICRYLVEILQTYYKDIETNLRVEDT